MYSTVLLILARVTCVRIMHYYSYLSKSKKISHTVIILIHIFTSTMLQIITGNADAFICLSVCYYLLTLQPQRNVFVIVSSMAFFAFGYGFIKYTRLLHPTEILKPHVEAEWRSRVVGFVHAVILIFGSILCFSEWWIYPANDGWVVETPNIYYYPELFASIFVGFLQYDLLWLMKNRKENFDPATIAHHILYIAITHYVLWGRFFCRPFAWLSCGELSTPFLHLRWFLIVTNKKASKLYSIYSKLFAGTFLFTRVICFGLGLVDLWLAKKVWMELPYGLYAVIFGVHLGFTLNLFWGTKVLSALYKLHLKNK